MKTIRFLVLATLSLGAFSGCETTGDPTQGGIFWSERKAQGRLAEREDRLDAIDSDTSRVQRGNRRLESVAERRARLLGE